MAIPAGIQGEHTLTVTPDIAVHFMGDESARVLGTPYLILNLEMAGRNLVLPHLDPGYDSVGTLVNVRHLAATPLGMKVTFRAEVLAVEERIVRFRVEAWDEKDKISEGIHERAIINVALFGAKVQAKIRSQSR